jgi:predicted RNase H-like HicB family nuclease
MNQPDLPGEITIEIAHEGGTYIATFPDLPGCMTEASSELELIANITDAILTHFGVPQEIAHSLDIVYLPQQLITRQPKTGQLKEKYIRMIADCKNHARARIDNTCWWLCLAANFSLNTGYWTIVSTAN